MDADEDIFDSSRVLDDKKRYHRQLVYGATSLVVTVLTVVGLGVFVIYIAAPEAYTPPVSPSPLLYFTNWSVFTSVKGCGSTSRRILKNNGTMADAAVATLLCMGVVHPHGSGIGGGLVALYYRRFSKRARVLVATGTAPAKYNLTGPNATSSGWTAAGVPGELHGYYSLLSELGTRLPWRDLFEDAINYATRGFDVDASLHAAMQAYQDDIRRDVVLSKYFVHRRRKDMYQVGDILRNPELGATLKTLAAGTHRTFYRGHVGESLLNDLQKDPQNPGTLTMADLSSYTPLWTEALTLPSADAHLWTSSELTGGPVFAFIWNMAQEAVLRTPQAYSLDLNNMFRLVESYKFALNKHTMLGDLDFSDTRKVVQEMLSGEYAERTMAHISTTRTQERQTYLHNSAGVPFSQSASGNYFGMVDIGGNVLLVASTLTSYFGSLKMSPSTGILMNNALHNFAPPKSNVPNEIKPRKRPLSPIGPVLFTDLGGTLLLALIAVGGIRIPTAISQVCIRHLLEGRTLKEAIDHPRVHVHMDTLTVDFERNMSDKLMYKLAQRGQHVEPYHFDPRVGGRLSLVGGFARGQGNFTVAVNVDFREGGGAVDGE